MMASITMVFDSRHSWLETRHLVSYKEKGSSRWAFVIKLGLIENVEGAAGVDNLAIK